MENIKIECPKCGWEPDGGSHWMCSKCRFVWNTFDTMARCPACSHQHEYTSCVPHEGGCHVREPHLDWYKNLDDFVKEEMERVKIEELEFV